MASSDNSKSISGSHSIPFSKPSSDAFQDMTAFSPPADSWIIQYPRRESQVKEEMRKPRVPEADQLESECRQFISSSEIPVKSNKSLGTDDHFKTAACSKNLLKVCEKLMTNKEFVTPSNDTAMDDDFGELSLMNERSRMEFYRKKHGNRRGSKSVPSSPKLERKAMPTEAAAVVSHNPYFTITKPEQRKEPSISFLTSLFGITAAKPAEANANLAQKYESDKASELKAANIVAAEESVPRKLIPKPHEYREMNLFSPTSM